MRDIPSPLPWRERDACLPVSRVGILAIELQFNRLMAREIGGIENKLLTVEEVAKKMGVSTSWVYRKCQARIMPHIKIGGVRRIPENDLQGWLNAHKIKGALKV